MGNISHDQCPKAAQETADGIRNCQLAVPGWRQKEGLGEDHGCDRRTFCKAELVGTSFVNSAPYNVTSLLAVPL